MVKKKEGRASWFKVHLHHKPTIEAVPDDAVGKALKAALRYFDSREVAELDSLARIVFAALKPSIDDAFADYAEKSAKNKRNIQKRWANRGIPSDTTGNHSLPSDTEREEDRRSTSLLGVSTAPGLEAGGQMEYVPVLDLEVEL